MDNSSHENKNPDSIGNIFNSIQRQQAFESISSLTSIKYDNKDESDKNSGMVFITCESSTRYKKDFVKSMVKCVEINKETLKNYHSVYMGSNLDIEYMLALGARNIIMVDWGFTSNEDIQKIVYKTTKLIRKKPDKVSENQYKFCFDFGDGLEYVNLTLEGKKYNEESELYFIDPKYLKPLPSIFSNNNSDKKEEKNLIEYEKFLPEYPIGMVVTNLSHYDFKKDSHLINKLIPGGYYLDACTNFAQNNPTQFYIKNYLFEQKKIRINRENYSFWQKK